MDAHRDLKRNPADAAKHEKAQGDRARSAHDSDGTETKEGNKARSDQPIDPNR